MADDEKKGAALAQAQTANTETTTGNEKPINEKTEGVAIPLGELGADVADANVDIEDALKQMPEHEAEILRKQIMIPDNKITYLTLFRFCSRNDLIVIIISAICAIGSGAAMPLMTVIFGDMSKQFAGMYTGEVSQGQFMDTIGDLALKMVYLFIGMFTGSYFLNMGFTHAGEHLTQKIRVAFMDSIMRQNAGYYDRIGAGEITVRITSDTNLIQTAISEKVGMTIMSLAMFISAYVIGFIKSWKLTLILTSTIVAMTLVIGVSSKFVIGYYRSSLLAAGESGTVSEEVFSSVRNCTAFGTEEKLARNYDKHLAVGEKWGRLTKVGTGLMIGGMMGIVYLNFGLAFWQGSEFILRGETDVGAIITTLLALMIGAFALAGVGPNVSHIQNGVAAGAKIFNTIDRVSPLDPQSDAGEKLETINGEIELQNVKFIYPSRPHVLVLPDMSLKIPAGKVTALVGPSGSGKSTIVGLLERLYLPIGGRVTLDGHDVDKLNIRWLRQNISLVSQEPTLFSVTIYENVCHGLIGTEYEHAPEEVKRKLVVEACKVANADKFINELPEGYETNVGQRGFLISGGQKQRIAIARAIVADPKILLLDEATSALDTKSEGVVQEALDRASHNRTTIVIAHRLSTIRNADNIVVMNKGVIVEQGTHEHLMSLNGEYAGLVEAQRISKGKAESVSGDSDSDSDETVEEVKRIASHTSADAHLTRTKTGESLASIALKKQPEEVKHKYGMMVIAKMIWKYSKADSKFMFPGMAISILMGGGSPVQGVFFAKSITALSQPPDMADKMRKDASFWSLMFLMLGLVQFFSTAVASILLGLTSESLVRRIRDVSFRTLLRQEMGYFDREENSTGEITSFLSTEAIDIASISGATLATIISGCTTVVTAIIVSCIMSWKLGLVCTACMPILISAGFLRMYLLRVTERKRTEVYAKSAAYATECTAGIRTVTALTRDREIVNAYHTILSKQTKDSLKSSAVTSGLYAWAESVTVLIVALGFWFGAKLMSNGELTIERFFISFTVVLFGAQSAGQIFAFAADIGKARNAAEKVKALVDRVPSIDTWSEEGEKDFDIQGEIEFRDVHFRYPTRPHVPVLRGLNLTVKPGQYVALVGQSGCGKSTTVALCERFYDVLHGAVLVDGRDVRDYHLSSFRKHVALVQQEPTLYQGTIKENILLGLGGFEDVPQSDIEDACRAANIHDFICSLPEGYNTEVGNKGGMLSGGQKQRIAIARALIRKPKILLLDEATSALDSESEKVVQAALDKAAAGRTTIAIAHRLSTIQNADCIYVFEGGRVIESGTHDELMAKKGRYCDLVKLQAMEEV